MKIAELRTMLGQALGIVPKDTPAEAPKFTVQPNRSVLRRSGVGTKHIHPNGFEPGTVAHTLAAHYVRRRRTGQPPHVQAWARQKRANDSLKNLQTMKIVQALRENKKYDLAKAFNSLAGGGFTTIWAITQASREGLLACNGFGEASLVKVHTYLTEHNVPVRWSL